MRINGAGWTYQEVLENIGGFGVRKKLSHTDVGRLDQRVRDVRVLGVQRVGEWDRGVLLDLGEGLRLVEHE